MAKSPAIIQLSLRPVYHEALRRRANELRMTEAETAASLVERGLEEFLEPGMEVEEARAERQLLDLAGAIAREEVANASEWNERLTFAVFERIRLEHRELYEKAAGQRNRESVNPRIARQIKTAVGAQVKKRNGRPVTLKAPRGSRALVSDYTLLLPPD